MSITVDIQYHINFRCTAYWLHSCNSQSDPPDKSRTHRAPCLVITILLTVFPELYFTSPGLLNNPLQYQWSCRKQSLSHTVGKTINWLFLSVEQILNIYLMYITFSLAFILLKINFKNILRCENITHLTTRIFCSTFNNSKQLDRLLICRMLLLK